MKKKSNVQVKQIADLAGVSPSTVSMVLNNRGGEFRIAESTSEKIMKAAEELGYEHPVRPKRRKRNYNKQLICAFCPTNFGKGPTQQLYDGIQRYLNEAGLKYEIILFPFEVGRLREKSAWISGEFIAGAILMALTEDDIAFVESTRFDVPVVLFNRIAKGYCSVLTDDYAVGFSAMSHFLQRGRRSFGIVSPNYSSRALSLRATGFIDKWQSGGFAPGESRLTPAVYGDDSDSGGYEAMERLLQEDPSPSAIFVPSDNMVSGVVRRLHDSGMSVPKQVEIISYGNKLINTAVSPGITSFAPPAEEMSYNCARLLHRFIEEGTLTDNVKLSFEASCVYRESSPEH